MKCLTKCFTGCKTFAMKRQDLHNPEIIPLNECLITGLLLCRVNSRRNKTDRPLIATINTKRTPLFSHARLPMNHDTCFTTAVFNPGWPPSYARRSSFFLFYSFPLMSNSLNRLNCDVQVLEE